MFKEIISEKSAVNWPVPWPQIEGLIQSEVDLKLNTAIREFLRTLLAIRAGENLINLRVDECEILLVEYADVPNDQVIAALRIANIRADWIYKYGLNDVTEIVMRAYRESRGTGTEGSV